MVSKAAFVTGISGQDGSYLTDLLLSKDYAVYGLLRRRANPEVSCPNLDHVIGDPRLKLLSGDLIDSGNLFNNINEIFREHQNLERLEVYNLGALSHVKVSFESPEYCAQVNSLGTLKVLEAIRMLPEGLRSKVRFYQASTSEMYGEVLQTPQTETTPFNPVSPYAISKLFGYFMVKNYREGYGMFACNGILFNHESPRRGMDFVTRKITVSLGKLLRGEIECLDMGNLDSSRDWGHARDYVNGMWLMLQAESPDDYVLATGETRTVREFITEAFRLKGIEITWEGTGVDERGIDPSGRVVVKINPLFFRPVEVEFLQGDASKAARLIGWKPTTSFESLVKEMVENDCK